MMHKILISLICIFLCLVIVAASLDLRDNSDLTFDGTIDSLSSFFSPISSAFSFVSSVAHAFIPRELVPNENAVYSDDVYFLLDYCANNTDKIDAFLSKVYDISVSEVNSKASIDNFFNTKVVSTNFHNHKVYPIRFLRSIGNGEVYSPDSYEVFYCAYCNMECGIRTDPYETLFDAFYEWKYPEGDLDPSVGLIIYSPACVIEFPNKKEP